MLEVFDRNRQRMAVLQNAFDISETRELNKLWSLEFSLPYNDPKNEFCNPFCYVRMDGGELYRILPNTLDVEESGAVLYRCEHVLATLMDNVLFGFHQVGNLGVYTADCIRYVLGRQIVGNWTLDRCDFSRQFEYGWEQENLLGALFSIPKPFTDPYLWVTDTSAYPWKLSLRRIDTNALPQMYIRRGKNMLSLQRSSDPQQLCTRLYALGYGEGVNQLTIKDVNNGLPYLQSPPEIIDKYGIIENVWIDRRYENPESLKEAAQAMLNELQEPLREYSVGYAQVGKGEFENAEIGKIVELIDPDTGIREKTYITGITTVYGDITDSTLTIANKPKDIASSVADLADRQRIEMTYAQGATQLFAKSLQVNADTRDGAKFNFFIPAEMRVINKVLAKIRVESFRAYSKTSSSNGGRDMTVYTQTQSQSFSIDSQRVESRTSTQEVQITIGGGGMGVFYEDMTGRAEGTSSSHRHSYSVDIEFPSEKQWVTIPGQEIYIRIPGQSFDITIPSQSIRFNIPSHSHEITPGIYRFGNPRSFTLFVNGQQKTVFSTTDAEIDLTPFLVGTNGLISRGSWQSIEIRPDSLAYVSVDMYFQGFVQSRGDATV